MARPLPVLKGLLPVLLAPILGWSDTLSYQGLAADQVTGKALYVERNLADIREGSPGTLKTEFRDMDGRKIAERVLDFSPSPFSPGYRFEDFRIGWEEGASIEKDGIRVWCRKGTGKPRKEKLLSVPGPAVIDGGFNAFLKKHLPELGAGRPVSFNFVVPSYLGYFRFAVKEDRSKGKGGMKVFVAEPENALLRLVAPRIEVTYDSSTGRMREYRGISNLGKEGGGNQYVRLTYPEGGP